MKKSLVWSVTSLGVVLLLSAVSLSARSSTTQTQVEATTGILATTSSVVCQVSTPLVSALDTFWDDGKKDGGDWNKGDGDGDNDGDDKKHKHHHEPAPEPSTLLSFGAAILIGGGLVYSRRLQRNRK